MSFFVYILHSSTINRFYIGTTDNIEKRLSEHNSAHYSNAFTTKGIPWILFLSIKCTGSRQAYEFERFLKKMKSSKFIEKLKQNPAIIEGLKARCNP